MFEEVPEPAVLSLWLTRSRSSTSRSTSPPLQRGLSRDRNRPPRIYVDAQAFVILEVVWLIDKSGGGQTHEGTHFDSGPAPDRRRAGLC